MPASAPCDRSEEISFRAGHAQHVAERQEDHTRLARDGMSLADEFERGDADGQPGPCTSSMPAGSSRSIPCLTIEWVCRPQTSMISQGRE